MKWLKKLLLFLPLFICCFALSGSSGNANASSTWVNNPRFHYWTLVYNEGLAGNGITRYESDATPPFNLMARPSSYTNYLVGMTVYGIDVSGYNYDSFTTFYLDFQLRVDGGGGKQGYFVNVPPYIKFVVDSWNTESCSLSSSSDQVYYQYHCAISLPENASPERLYLDIGQPYSTGAPFSPISAIPSNAPSGAVVKINYLGYGFDTQPNKTNQYLDVLSSQNQTMINQNQTIINQNNQIINQQQATNDWLTDNTAPNVDTSSLGNAAGWLPAGPLDSILNLPIQFIQGIVGIFTGNNTCQPFTIPIPWVDYNLEIPCMRPLFDQAGWSYIWNGVGTIISAVLIFHTFSWLYQFVEKTLSMRENDNEVWGGL